MSRQSDRFARKIEDLRRKTVNLDKDILRRTRRLGRSLVDQIKRDIAGAEGWDAEHLTALKNAIDARIRTFDASLKGLANEETATGWGMGVSHVDDPITAAEIRLGLPDLSTADLIVSQNMTADLVTGVSAEARKLITNAVSLSVIGKETPFEAMKKVDKIIGAKVDRGVTYRAEQIVRTEVKRAQSIATQARLEQATQQLPTLQKQWLWSGKVHGRANHQAIDGQVKNVNEPFIIPGGPRGSYEAMSPRDPSLPASEIINCGCDVTPFVPELEEE